MDVLDGRPVWSLTDGEVLPACDSVDAEIIRLQSIRLQLTARIEETGYAQELGARDSVELLSLRYRQDRPEAWREVRLARALPKYNAVGTALIDGIKLPDDSEGADVPVVRPMRTAQAAAIVSELERVRSRVPVEDLDIAEEQLVQLAGHLSPSELRAAAKEICNLLDSDGPEPEENKAYERESLTLTNADLGVKFRGYLANENAELLRAVIHAGARPHKTTDGEQDPRPREKRQADALTTALTLATNAWDTTSAGATAGTEAEADGTGTNTASATEKNAAEKTATEKTATFVPGHGAKACLTVTIDLQDLKAATATAIGRTVYGDGLSAAAIRRLACDAKVIPIVLGSNSEPLDVGRQERLVTRAMRRALNTRDRGCVVCGAPPIMCDAHHVVSWIDGGETKLNNLALLCRRHHVDLHNARWTITITNGHVTVTRPTWADPQPRHTWPDPKPIHLPKPPPSPPTRPAPHPDDPARPRPSHSAPPRAESRPDDPARPSPSHTAPTRGTPHPDDPARPRPSHSAPPRAEPRPDDPAGLVPSPSDPAHPDASAKAPAHASSPRTDPPDAEPADDLARTESSDLSSTPTDDPQSPSSPTTANPWPATTLPAATTNTAARAPRWKGDAATYAEAARFAVWHPTPADAPDPDPPSFATI